MAQRVSVPADVAALKVLERVDYHDAFAAETCEHRSAEQWARLCFEVDPPAVLLIPALVLAPFGIAAGRAATTGIGGLQIRETSLRTSCSDSTSPSGRPESSSPHNRAEW
jgi:hypothetical protein